MKANNLSQELIKNQFLISEKEKWVTEIQGQRDDYQKQIHEIKQELLEKMNLLENKNHNIPDNSHEFNHLKNAISELHTQINFLNSKNESLMKAQKETMNKISSQKNETRIIREEQTQSVPRKSYVSERVIKGSPIVKNVSSVRYEVFYFFLFNLIENCSKASCYSLPS